VLRYDVVDVFTDRAYAGNPLAVVHGGQGLSTAAMQSVAAEFGLSETAFPMPPTREGADYRLRIFTPARELPFAGHPSVGAAWVLARDGVIGHGEVVQECGAGLLEVWVDAAGARVCGGAPQVGPPLCAAQLTRAVGLDPGEVDAAVPAGVASAGVPYAFLAVRPAAVARSAVDAPALRAAAPQAGGVVVVAFDPQTRSAHLRMFAPELGVVEDPATGSAALALAVFLVDRGVLPREGPAAFTVAQGGEIGRQSRLVVAVEAHGGAAGRTSVQGGVAAVARGELLALPPDPG